MTREIGIEEWGKDHWALLGYAADRAVNHEGLLDDRKMRQDGKMYPTFLKQGEEKEHNDYNCLDDLEREGFLENRGTGLYPVVKLTAKGLQAWQQLTAHKQDGKRFKDFIFDQNPT